MVPRPILFRFLAILFGLALVFVSEGLLRLTNLGKTADFDDPFVSFSEIKPLFVLNDQGDRYEISSAQEAFFRPASFGATKRSSEFRIFCLGGSTVQGRPYAPETSFTTWLELSLKAADSSRDWQVVNCGGVSFASYRLLPIVREVLEYSPDLLILYTGHNEFLEDRTYPQLKRLPAWLKHWHQRLTNSRIYGLLCELRSGLGLDFSARRDGERATLSADVDALLDYRGGLAEYHRDDDWRAGVVEHFELSLRRMVRLAHEATVPMLIVNPVSNLKDSPPFKAANDETLTSQEQAKFRQLWRKAKATPWSRLHEKAELVQRALAIDDRHANAHFLMGKIYEAMAKSSAAKASYLRAKDEDICPLRMLEEMHDITRRLAKQSNKPLVDIRQTFEALSAGKIPGEDLLIDHVHPRIDGHQLIAEQLFAAMKRRGLVRPRPDWRNEQQKSFASHWATLPANYFPESVARLRGLRRWSQGRAARLRPNVD